MIKTLNIESFGKFKNRVFNFGKVNFVYGKNEAGKSTLFDAIFHTIAKPKGNHSEGKRLTRRYGDERTVTIEGNIPDSIDPDEFLNLHSLKAGEIRMEFGKGKWLENLKKQMFSGGIDPLSIAKELEPKSVEKGNNVHIKEKKFLEAKLDSNKNEIQNIIDKKDSLLKQEQTVIQEEGRKESLQKEIQVLKSEIQDLETEIQLQDTIRKKKSLSELYRNLTDWKAHFAKLKDLAHYEKDQSAELDSLQNQKNNLQGRLSAMQASFKAQEDQILGAEKNLTEKQEQFHLDSNLENLARNMKERVESILKEPKTVLIVKWNIPYLVVSLILLAVGLVVFVYDFPMKETLFLLGIGTMFLSILLLFISRKTASVRDVEQEKIATLKYSKEWNETHRAPRLNIGDLDEIRQFLIQFINKRNSDTKQFELDKMAISNSKEQCNQLKTKIDELTEESTEIDRKINNWLDDKKIQSREEYLIKCKEYSRSYELKSSLEKIIRSRFPSDNFEDLLTDANRKIANLEEKNIPSDGLDDSQYQKLKSDHSKKKESLESLSNKERKLDKDTTIVRANVEAQLNPLSEELSRLQNETILTEKELLRNESTRLASKIAMEIFEKMGEETNDILVSLATEIASSSGSIFSKKREILINNLNGDIEMEDESGVMRHIDHLSLGTKDSFYIAAKLALCERKDPDLKLFILDEPFLSLDENRGDQALEVLKNYVKNKDWQIIFLSKEEELGKKLKSLFPNDFNRINL